MTVNQCCSGSSTFMESSVSQGETCSPSTRKRKLSDDSRFINFAKQSSTFFILVVRLTRIQVSCVFPSMKHLILTVTDSLCFPTAPLDSIGACFEDLLQLVDDMEGGGWERLEELGMRSSDVSLSEIVSSRVMGPW